MVRRREELKQSESGEEVRDEAAGGARWGEHGGRLGCAKKDFEFQRGQIGGHWCA